MREIIIDVSELEPSRPMIKVAKEIRKLKKDEYVLMIYIKD